MKKHKILQVFLAVAVTCLLSACVGINSSSQEESSLSSQEESTSSQEETFWEGQVQPGTYKGSWTEPNAGGTSYVEGTLTIYDDQTVKYKRREKLPWGEEWIEVSTGNIEKHVETYDGERKVWYGVDTDPEPGSSISMSMNISTSLEFSGANCRTYQEYNGRRGQYGYLHKQ